MPLVSVIIPCFNHGRYLDEAVNSVLLQTFQDFEIIIVNDGSTDSFTNELLLDYRRPKTRVIHIENSGVSNARNVGIMESTGRYILPLDADDKILPTYIEKAVREMEQNPILGIVYAKAKFFGKSSGELSRTEYHFPEILNRNCIVCTALFKRESWQRVGGYKKEMRDGLEDYEFWISLIEDGAEVFKIPETLFEYRIHTTSRTTVANKNTIKLVSKIILLHLPLYIENFKSLSFPVKILTLLGRLRQTRLRILVNILIYILNYITGIFLKLKRIK